LALGALRAEASDGAWCEVRHAWLQVADSAACVRTMESCEHGRRRVVRTIEFDQVSVRHRPGERALVDRLVLLAESMAEGECSVLPVWVSSTRPTALLHAIPVDPCGVAGAPRCSDVATASRTRSTQAARVKA
jgi:hypothetical protein